MRSDVLRIMSGTRSSRVSACLHERGEPAWAAATTHPMVREIAAGTLPHGTFRRYFEQNVLYLGDYARAIGLIIGKAPDLAAVDVLSRFLGQIGADYAALVEETTGLLDRLGDPRDAVVMQRLSWIFDTSTRYEVQFWDMAYGEERTGLCALPESSRT